MRGRLTIAKGNFLRKIKERILNEDQGTVDDVVRLTIGYLLAAVLGPTQSGNITWNVCEYLEDIDRIFMYDWQLMVVQELNDQLVATTTMKLGGPVVLGAHTNRGA